MSARVTPPPPPRGPNPVVGYRESWAAFVSLAIFGLVMLIVIVGVLVWA